MISTKYNLKLRCVVVLVLFLLSQLLIVTLPIKADTEEPWVQWSQTYSAGPMNGIRSMVPTRDGGFALAGTAMYLGDPRRFTSDVWLVKTDANGEVQWTQSYMNLGEASSVVQTIDGGYALNGGNILIKTDPSGNIQWNQTYSSGGTTCIVQTNEGGYATAGTVFSANYSFWLVKTDAFGNYQWNQSYSGNGAVIAWSLRQTRDGGYVLAGGSSFGDFGYLVKTDSSGTIQWNQTYAGMPYSVIQTKDDGYALAGELIAAAGNTNVWLAKIDSLGNLKWNQTFGLGGARSVIQTNDGGYVLAGNSSLIKTDFSGSIQWSQNLNGTAYSVVQTSNESYVLAGGDANTLFKGAWLMKTSVTTPTTNPDETPKQSINPSPSIPEFPIEMVLLLIVGATLTLAGFFREETKRTIAILNLYKFNCSINLKRLERIY